MIRTVQHQENPVTNPEAVPHPYIVTTIPNGQDIDWPHPDNCPAGDACDILRRIRRAPLQDMADLAEGRPDGTYRIGRFGFRLVLIDDEGRILPDATA